MGLWPRAPTWLRFGFLSVPRCPDHSRSLAEEMVYFSVDFRECLSHQCHSRVVKSGPVRPLKNLTPFPPRKPLHPGRGFCDQQRASWKLLGSTGPQGCVQSKIRSLGSPRPMRGQALPYPLTTLSSGAGCPSPHLWILGGAGVVIFILLPARGFRQQTRGPAIVPLPPGVLDCERECFAPQMQL